jgi:hypothetical protein
MNDSLTTRQAYTAMFAFLEAIWQRTQSDELAALLGQMSRLKDGGTADPAVWADWEVAVRKVQAGAVDAAMRLK